MDPELRSWLYTTKNPIEENPKFDQTTPKYNNKISIKLEHEEELNQETETKVEQERESNQDMKPKVEQEQELDQETKPKA